MANANVGFWLCLVADSVVWREDITMEGASNQAVGAEPLVSLYMSREDFCTPGCFFRLVGLHYVFMYIHMFFSSTVVADRSLESNFFIVIPGL